MSLSLESVAVEQATKVKGAHKISQRDLDEAERAYSVLSTYVNNMGHRPEAFAAHFLADHRTLQQQVVNLMLFCLYALAATPSTFTDARNEAAWMRCKDIVEQLGDLGYAMPLI